MRGKGCRRPVQSLEITSRKIPKHVIYRRDLALLDSDPESIRVKAPDPALEAERPSALKAFEANLFEETATQSIIQRSVLK